MNDEQLQTVRQNWSQTVAGDPDDADLTAARSYRHHLAGQFGQACDLEQEPIVALEKIASGGMGEVYRARQTLLRRDVAMKKLHPERRATLTSSRAFLAEAIITGQLEHPNIVPVYALGADREGDLFLAMKLVGGCSWHQRLHEERPWQGDAAVLVRHLEILLQVGNAVAFAHSKGIAHNDLKPGNVMLGDYGEVLVLDWGLAVDISEPRRAELGLPHKSELHQACGTPAYLPPELAEGDGPSLGPWTDVYLLGGILCELLTGKPPHPGGQLMRAISACLAGVEPEFPPHVPAELRRICLKALSRERGARQQSVPELQRELRTYLRHGESYRVSEQAWLELRTCREQAASDQRRASPVLYERFAEILASFKHACKLWPDNQGAREGVCLTRLAYAEAGLARGDLGLAASQLSRLDAPEPSWAEQQEGLASKVAQAQQERRRNRRNRTLLRGGLLALGGLLLVVLASAYLLVRDRNRRIEEEKTRVAEAKRFSDTRGEIAAHALSEVVGRVLEKLTVELKTEHSQAVAREILAIAQEGWQRLRDTNLAESRVSWGSALSLSQVGLLEMFAGGDASKARRDLAEAVELLRRFTTDPEVGMEARALLARTLGYLAKAEQRLGYLEAALISGHEGVAMARQLVAADTSSAKSRSILARNLIQLSEMLWQQRQSSRSLELLEESLGLRRRAYAEESGRDSRVLLADVLRVAANRLLGDHDLQRARGLVDELLAIDESLLRDRPGDPSVVAQLCLGLQIMARICLLESRFGQAEQVLQETLERARGLVAFNPSDHTFRLQEAGAIELLATLRSQQLRAVEARELYQQAIAIYRELSAYDPQNTALRAELVQCLQAYQAELLAPELRAEARANLAEILPLQRQMAEADSLNFAMRETLAVCLLNWGELLLQEDPAAAHQALTEARQLLDQARSQDPESPRLRLRLAAVLRNLAITTLDREDPELVLRLARQALQEVRQAGAANELHRATQVELMLCQQFLGAQLVEAGHTREAEALFSESAEVCRASLAREPDDFKLLGDLSAALLGQGEALEQRGALTEARECYIEAQQVQQRRASLEHIDGVLLLLEHAAIGKHLADNLMRAGQLLEARDRYEELLELRFELQQLVPGALELQQLHDCLYNLATCCLQLDDLGSARRYAEQAQAVAGELEALRPGDASIEARFCSDEQLARLHLRQGDGQRARLSFEAALAGARSLLAVRTADIELLIRASHILRSLARLAGGRGQHELAEAHGREALQLSKRALAVDAENLGARQQCAASHFLLANGLAVGGDLVEAQRHADAALALMAEIASVSPQLQREHRTMRAIRGQLAAQAALPEPWPDDPVEQSRRAQQSAAARNWLEAVGWCSLVLRGDVDPDMLEQGARAAARAAAGAEQPLQGQLEVLALEWLGSLFQFVRQVDQELRAAGELGASQRAGLIEQWRSLREADDFGDVRGLPGFPPLLED